MHVVKRENVRAPKSYHALTADFVLLVCIFVHCASPERRKKNEKAIEGFYFDCPFSLYILFRRGMLLVKLSLLKKKSV